MVAQPKLLTLGNFFKTIRNTKIFDWRPASFQSNLIKSELADVDVAIIRGGDTETTQQTIFVFRKNFRLTSIIIRLSRSESPKEKPLSVLVSSRVGFWRISSNGYLWQVVGAA